MRDRSVLQEDERSNSDGTVIYFILLNFIILHTEFTTATPTRNPAGL